MKVKGLNGRTYNWKLQSRPSDNASSFHKRARQLLEKMFPLEPRLEEVALPGTKSLRCDFYLPKRNLMVEVHGEQHYQFIARFHQTPMGFLQSRQRDENKKRWAELNELTFVELPYRETDDEWRRRIEES